TRARRCAARRACDVRSRSIRSVGWAASPRRRASRPVRGTGSRRWSCSIARIARSAWRRNRDGGARSAAGIHMPTDPRRAATAIDALRQGAYDYVTKPFDLDEVNQIVERGIANRRLKAINRQLVQELHQKNEMLERHEQVLRERVRVATDQMTRLFEAGKE